MSNKKGLLRLSMVFILVIVQVVFVVMLSVFLQSLSAYVYYVIAVFSLIVIIGLINDNRSPSYKISWIIILLILPVTGYIFYYLWGRTNLNKKQFNNVLDCIKYGRQFIHQDVSVREQFKQRYPYRNKNSQYLENEGYPIFKDTDMKYYSMGDTFFKDLIEDLKNAEKFILIEFFIVSEGKLWDEIHEILKQKVRKGVEVKFIIDDLGTVLRIKNGFIKELRNEGIEVQVFNSVQQYISKLYANHRNHQKIVVIDGNIGYTGGANLADEYINSIVRFGVWKDSGVRLEGAAVWSLTTIFLEMWDVTNHDRITDYMKYAPVIQIEKEDFCQPFADGPANNPKNPAENLFKQIITGANEFLYIMTPYLVPELDMIELIKTSAHSNIDVKIITPGIPDKKLVNLITKYNYGKLLSSGVKIYEYTPGFIHSKNIICEDNGVIGTINMDFRSFNLHHECGVWVCGNHIVQEAKEDFLSTLTQCREVSYEDWKHRPVWMKIVQPLLCIFSTVM